MKNNLLDIANIQVGYQSREGNQDDARGSHYLIQARDFDKAHQLDWRNLLRFNPTGEASRYEVKRGDILFLAKGQEHFAYCIDREINTTLTANTFYVIRSNNLFVDSAFLAWWINQPPAQKYFLTQRVGSSIPFVPVAVLEKLEVILPPVEMQAKIARLDTLYRREKELLQLLIDKKTVFYNAICLEAVQSEERSTHAKSHIHQ